MDRELETKPAWLPELVVQVAHGLQRLAADKQDQHPALEQELQEIEERIQGWSASLANPKLPTAVREGLETKWGAAVERQQQIQADLSTLKHEVLRAEQLVRPEQVLERLERLGEVLAAQNPTRGNLELSLHIDRIVCSRDGAVSLRMCKLGIMPDVVGLLAGPVGVIGADRPENAARRRSPLRVTDDDATVDLRAQASFIADPHRFAGLSEEFFWVDKFQIPESASWASDNAEAVFRRRQESRWSYAQLAPEFKVTPPTIGAAIRAYLKAHPDERDEVCLQRGGKRKPKFDLASIADEARTLWLDGWSKEKLAKKYGCSAPTVHKAIDFAYRREGLTMPTRKEGRRQRIAQARGLLDSGMSLDQIAVTLKVSDVTARQYLNESFAAEGQTKPDLRRRKQA